MTTIPTKPAASRRWAAGVALCLAGAAAADDAERHRYHYFARSGVLDAGASNETVNAMVREGVASGDAEIVDSTVRGIVALAVHRTRNMPSLYGPLPERTLPEVTGLKAFLIGYWRVRHEAAGRDPPAAVGKALREAGLDGPLDCDAARTAECYNRYMEHAKATPPWVGVPLALCAFWPQDGDVHDLIWEQHETSRSNTVGSATLELLNVGGFTTPRAEAFRVARLAALEGGGDEAAQEVSEVVRGLALGHPPNALGPLIEAARGQRGAVREDILVALAGYDDEQLAAHAAALREVVAGGRPAALMGAEVEAYDRLETIAPAAP